MEIGEHRQDEPPVPDCDCRRCAVATRDDLRKDAERYRWCKENMAIEVEVFRGRYRCTTRDSVVTDWLSSYDEAIDAAMSGANA